jgi:hypothetical protein
MTSFDSAADRILEPLRNNKASVALFGFASTIGDFRAEVGLGSYCET